MRAAVLVFPGSNCDHDAVYVLQKFRHVIVENVWHTENDLSRFDAIIIPGGFSYGDYLRAGSIARFSPIMQAVITEAKRGKIIIGICNGFQILIEAGLLPGALLPNKKLKFLSQNVQLKVESTKSIFTRKYKIDQSLTMPIAHKQGNYSANPDLIKSLKDNDQIAFTYDSVNGGNPNGSVANIAGIFNRDKNILGMMPHPERASESVLGSSDGSYIFKSIVGER